MRTKLPFVLGLCLLACSDTEPKTLDREALMDPASCQGCHPRHYEEWSGSMHAYASYDPVFLAMNARGQRETNGELGDFCVRCHAPMAVLSGATTDGSNLSELPAAMQGVTCYFCHSVDAVEGSHNNPLRLAEDMVLRAAIKDPVENSAHHSAYSPLLDRDQRSSADLCGSCHDIVTPANVHLERTYAEWQASLFGNGSIPIPLTCGNCHMPKDSAPAADAEGVVVREIHDHRMPAVDIALDSFPHIAEQTALVKNELSSVLIAQLCVSPPLADTEVEITLENAFAGHSFPSGAAQDRRAWVELIGYQGDEIIYQSGVVEKGKAVTEHAGPDAWILRDRMFDSNNQEVHMFWQAASVSSELLPQASSNDILEIHSKQRVYKIPLSQGVPDRISMRVLMRPMGLEVLQSLVDSGDLDSAVLSKIETFTVVDTITWRHDRGGYGCVPEDPFGSGN